MIFYKDMIEAMDNGETAIDYIHRKRQERYTDEGHAFWEALQGSATQRDTNMKVKITTNGIPVDPYYFGEE